MSRGLSLRGLAAYHSWFALMGIVFPALRGRGAGPLSSKKRTDYLREHENLEPVFRMIADADADVAILNEVIPEIHGPRIESKLRALGFNAIALGLGAKYPDAHISTYIAAKENGESVPVEMPQLPLPGKGGGAACLRLVNGISVIGAHTSFGGTRLWKEQINSLVDLARSEQQKGQEIILAGDWNEIDAPIFNLPSIRGLKVVSTDPQGVPTCPTSLPSFLQRQLDHILIPQDWKPVSFQTIDFGSDHLAICADIANSKEV